MAYNFSLGLFYKDLTKPEYDILMSFKESDNFRKCHTTGAEELFLYYPKHFITKNIESLISYGILMRHSFDSLNLYLLDDRIENYNSVKSKEDFSKIFNNQAGSYNSFLETLSMPKYFRYYGFYRSNKSLVKKIFYENNHKDDNVYQEHFYSSTQEFVQDHISDSNTDIVGEIKTKQFQKYGNIRKHT